MIPVSHSELKCFQRCGQEWFYRYVEKREAKEKALPLAIGLAIHAAIARKEYERTPLVEAMLYGYWMTWGTKETLEHDVFFLKDIGDDVHVTGEIDAIASRKIREHKTTSEDISPGAAYWRGIIHADPQVSMYLAAFGEKELEWDVLRKPALRQKNNESDKEFYDRLVESLLREPPRYYQRATIVRMRSEHEEHLANIKKVVKLMQLPVTRNRSSCFVYGRPCDFFDVCSGETTLDDDSRFQDSEYVKRREVRINEWLEK